MYADPHKIISKRSRDFIRKIVRLAGYEIVETRETRRELNLLGVILGMSLNRDSKHPISVVQVGANDGSDELREIIRMVEARVLLIEPNPELIPILIENYRGVADVQVANVAIDSVEGYRDLYTLSGKTKMAYTSDYRMWS